MVYPPQDTSVYYNAMKPDSVPVVVIVPVFRNLAATQRCIESVLASDAGPRTRLIIINDDSPEPDVSSWCEELDVREGVTVLRNPQNLGFVATVNRGIDIDEEADVVLLNSDAEVANNWLQRLQDCAYSDEAIATVTPLSNNASVCSYPLPLQENTLPAGWTLQALDALAARVNRGKSLSLPTAVGFCMYIRRACLDAIGSFDEDNFGVGYGEECDFSMRAKAAGWTNALCPDVFVYHEGGQSFTTQTDGRIRAAEETLQRLHPQYHVQATQFIDEDPVRPFRDALDRGRMEESAHDAKPVVAALQSHRDSLIDSKSNREMSLEHAFGEIKNQCVALSEQVDATGKKLGATVQRLDATEQKLNATEQNLGARTLELEQTQYELKLTQRELKRLLDRDRRWRYLIYIVNRFDEVRMWLAGARISS